MSYQPHDGVIADQYSDQLWRLNNLYHIQDKQGKDVLFKLNIFQQRFYDEMWYLNCILKARQFGFTTFIDLFILDSCIWNANTKGGIIAHKLEDAQSIFTDKIQYPYRHLPEGIKAMSPVTTERANHYEFGGMGEGSSIRVSTSYRSGTLQLLHVSEYGKIAATRPDKAKEINTGAIEAVAKGQMIFIESTAEGREGEFYDLVDEARQLEDSGKDLDEMDFKFHFYAWWENPEYTLNPAGVAIPQKMHQYFEMLHESWGIETSTSQRAWYVKKQKRLKDDMKREYPSTADEAFEAVIDGSYYGEIVKKLRVLGRLKHVPYDPLLPVHTFWDLGINDTTDVIFFQQRGMERRIIDFYENAGEGMAHYARILGEKPYVYGTHYFPHDVNSKSLQTGKTLKSIAETMGIRPIKAIPRAKNNEEVMAGIENVRNLLATCWIDEEKCAHLIKALEAYRKDWDDRLGTFKKTPLHNWACLPKGVEIVTPEGVKQVQDFVAGDKVAIGGIEAEVVRAEKVKVSKIIKFTLSDGSVIRCSEDHKIFANTRLVMAKDIGYNESLLTNEDVIQWSQKKEGIRKAFTESLKASGIDTGKRESFTQARLVGSSGCCIESYGGALLVRCQKAMQSCLLMATGIALKSITGCVGLTQRMVSALKPSTQGRNIKGSCSDSSLKQGTTEANLAEQQRSCTDMFGKQLTGKFRKALQFITSIMIVQTIGLKILRLCRFLTIRGFMQKLTNGLVAKQIRNNSNPQATRLQLFVVKIEMQPPEPVYDIEVRHHHAYVLAGSGVVTSNSNAADAMRTGAVGLNSMTSISQSQVMPDAPPDY